MAIPPGVSILDFYNSQINNLVHTRDKYLVYNEDWDTLPNAVKNAIKAAVNQVITDTKSGLDDTNAAIQARQ